MVKAPVKPPCEVCGAPSVKRHLCSRHYQARRTGRAPNHRTPQCTLEGCSRPHHARGWCNMHYQRWKAHGDPEHRLVGYVCRERPRPRRAEPTVITTLRLPHPVRGRVEYAAALAGEPVATYLRHLIEETHRA